MSSPRAYTEDEIRDMLLNHFRVMADYWATLPDIDVVTGRPITVKDRCDGVVFSILSALDGCAGGFPCAVTLKMDPHPEDKQFLESNGENWVDPGTEIADMLHEYYYRMNK